MFWHLIFLILVFNLFPTDLISSDSLDIDKACKLQPKDNCTLNGKSNSQLIPLFELNNKIEEMGFVFTKVKGIRNLLKLEYDYLKERSKGINSITLSNEDSTYIKESYTQFKNLYLAVQEVESYARKVNYCVNSCSRFQLRENEDKLKEAQRNKLLILAANPTLQHKSIEKLISNNLKIDDNDVITKISPDIISVKKFKQALFPAVKESISTIKNKIKRYDDFIKEFNSVEKAKSETKKQISSEYQDKFHDVISDVLSSPDTYGLLKDIHSKSIICRIYTQYETERKKDIRNSMALSATLTVLPIVLPHTSVILSPINIGLRAAAGIKWGQRISKIAKLTTYGSITGYGTFDTLRSIEKQSNECKRIESNLMALSVKGLENTRAMKKEFYEYQKCKKTLSQVTHFATIGVSTMAVATGVNAAKLIQNGIKGIKSSSQATIIANTIFKNVNLSKKEKIIEIENLISKKLSTPQIKALEKVLSNNYKNGNEEVLKILGPYFNNDDIKKGISLGLIGPPPYTISSNANGQSILTFNDQVLAYSLKNSEDKDKIIQLLRQKHNQDNLKINEIVTEAADMSVGNKNLTVSSSTDGLVVPIKPRFYALIANRMNNANKGKAFTEYIYPPELKKDSSERHIIVNDELVYDVAREIHQVTGGAEVEKMNNYIAFQKSKGNKVSAQEYIKKLHSLNPKFNYESEARKTLRAQYMETNHIQDSNSVKIIFESEHYRYSKMTNFNNVDMILNAENIPMYNKEDIDKLNTEEINIGILPF